MNYSFHIQLMSKYNTRMNSQIYSSALDLSEVKLNENLGAFFGSIIGTLNHILVGDILWFSRFSKLSSNFNSLAVIASFDQPKALDQILYTDINELWGFREKLDRLIEVWAHSEVKDCDWNANLNYASTSGQVSQRNFGELVAHVFNHQAHHRGQISTLFSQLGVNIGATDFVLEIPKTA